MLNWNVCIFEVNFCFFVKDKMNEIVMRFKFLLLGICFTTYIYSRVLNRQCRLLHQLLYFIRAVVMPILVGFQHSSRMGRNYKMRKMSVLKIEYYVGGF